MTALPLAGLAAAAVAYGTSLAALWALQDKLLLHPGRQSPDMGSALPHRERDWTPQGAYAGYVVEPAGASAQLLGTILIFHGNAGNAEGRLPLAARFASLGYRAVLAEYPGFGRREGQLTLESALDACKRAFEDARREWPGRLVLCGESLGAGMAGQVLRDNEALVTAAIFATPWDSLAAVAQSKLPFYPVKQLLQLRFDTAAAIEQFTGPAIVIASSRDTLIPVKHARKLVERASVGTFLELEAGHNDWYRRMSEADWARVTQALGRARVAA